MKVVVKISLPEQNDRLIFLSEDEMFVEELDERLIIDSKYEDRFNSLLSLFMLKDDWEGKQDIDYNYKIMFEDNDNIEIYSFSEEPNNFSMFMGYLVRLVGDSL